MNIVELPKLCETKAIEVQSIFVKAFGTDTGPDFLSRVNEKRNLSAILAYEDDQLVGFKLGYEKHRGTFLSWLGAVTPDKKRKGIARVMLRHQHELVTKRGYAEIQTEALGTNVGMLMLNLSEGFTIYGTQLNRSSELTVLLRKLLQKS